MWEKRKYVWEGASSGSTSVPCADQMQREYLNQLPRASVICVVGRKSLESFLLRKDHERVGGSASLSRFDPPYDRLRDER